MAAEIEQSRTLNINVGILGHVDSGKTSLSKALSTMLSTAALDKSSQSQARGITLDLGFSAMVADAPPHLADKYDKVQFTLVDCPGHASLIKTIIGGAQIIDMMVLVVDINKGIQTQTAECLVIGEILTENMVVVLNKTDMLKNPAKQIPKKKEKLRNTFKATKFGADVPMVALSANPGGTKVAADIQDSGKGDVKPLVDLLLANLKEPKRKEAGDFYFAVDHCFSIKGQGTVLTGTVLNGSVEVNQIIELPTLKLERKVKSMQMFRAPVQSAKQGDRVGICVTQLDATAMERGVVCAPGTVGSFKAVICSVEKIRFYKGAVKNKTKFHVTVGHSTSMATAHFFYLDGSQVEDRVAFDMNQEYVHSEMLMGITKDRKQLPCQYCVLVFDTPVTCPLKSVVIGSRLDQDIYQNSCRLAFTGRLEQSIAWEDTPERAKLKVYKLKQRVGAVDRVHDDYTIIGKDLFSKNTDMGAFLGLKVELEATGQVGRIDSAFGQGGKFKAFFEGKLPEPEASAAATAAPAGKRKKKAQRQLKSKVLLKFKTYVFAEKPPKGTKPKFIQPY